MARDTAHRIVAETDRLILREWAPDEFETLKSILGHAETMRHWPEAFSDGFMRKWLRWAGKTYRERGYGRWAVCLKPDGQVIGDCGLFPIEIDGKPVTDLGYIIHADFQRQGYGPEAARAALSIGLDQVGLRDIVCHMADDHTASMKVAERIGLVRTGSFVNPENRHKRHLIFQPPVYLEERDE